MGFRSKATVQKSKSIARVTAPPTPQIFSPTGASFVHQGGTPTVPVPAWIPTGGSIVYQGASNLILSPNLLPGNAIAAWYAADLISGLSDGAAVSTWADISGNAYDVTQATAANKPTYKTSIVNGLPIVRFDGANDRLNNAVISVAQAFTVFAVVNATSSVSNKTIVGGLSAGTPGNAFFMKDNADHISIYCGTALAYTGSSMAGAFHVVEAVANGSSSAVSLDGAGATGNANTTRDFSAGISIGSVSDSLNLFIGDIAEVIICSGDIGTTLRNAFRAYLGAKYAISVV